MNNSFIPYSQHVFPGNEIEAVQAVLKDGWIARGNRVNAFEQMVANKYGYTSTTACSSGSAALEIVLRSLGLTRDDEVIVPTITWAATASAVIMAGGRVVFADIDRDTINADAQQLERHITRKTKAIIVVHLSGRPCNMDAIWKLADKHSIRVIEDAAHAFGSQYLDGTPIASSHRSYASIFSFHPAKNITTGEGGLVVTQHKELDPIFKLYRDGGVSRNSDSQFNKAQYKVLVVSSNYHMTEMQAALGIEQLKSVDSFIATRRQLADTYFDKIKNKHIILPPRCEHSSWNLFIIKTTSQTYRDKLFAYLQQNNIGCYFHYPPLHLFSVTYGSLGKSLVNAENYSHVAITLPIGPHISCSDAMRICDTINGFDEDTLN